MPLSIRDDEGHAKDWIAEYGEGQFSSACSCLVTSPLPTRTTHGTGHTAYETIAATNVKAETSTDLTTTVVKFTETEEIYGHTITVTLPFTRTVAVGSTVTEYVTVDGAAQLS